MQNIEGKVLLVLINQLFIQSYASDIKCYKSSDVIHFTGKNLQPKLNSAHVATEKRDLSLTLGTEDIEIEFELGIPFITIPIGKQSGIQLFPASARASTTSSRAKRSMGRTLTANVNLAAIAFLGFGAVVITGISYLLIALHKGGIVARSPSDLSIGNQVPIFESPASKVFEKLQDSVSRGFAKYGINGVHCLQKFICDYTADVLETNRKDTDFLKSWIRVIMDSNWIQHQLDKNTLGHAVVVAVNGEHCWDTFNECSLSPPFI